MQPAGSTHAAPSFQAFTVLIPRPLRPTVEGLPTLVRQALLAELFRLATLAQEQHALLPEPGPHTLRVEAAGYTAYVELDATRSRVMLVGVPRHAVEPQA
jgi:hypothetical protein